MKEISIRELDKMLEGTLVEQLEGLIIQSGKHPHIKLSNKLTRENLLYVFERFKDKKVNPYAINRETLNCFKNMIRYKHEVELIESGKHSYLYLVD